MIGSFIRQDRRASVTRLRQSALLLGLMICAPLLAACNPGLIKMDSAIQLDTTASMDDETQKVIRNPKIRSGYLSVETEYLEPGHPTLPDELRQRSGKALIEMCRSGLKYDDKELSSLASLKIGANGALDDKSIPVSGFTLKRSGSACELVGESKRITNEYPVEGRVLLHYGLRSSSGAEIPINDMQNALKVIGTVASPGTFAYRVATDTVLQNIGETANRNIKTRLSTSLSDSRSVNVDSLSKAQAFFIPIYFQRKEENTFTGFIRINTVLNPSVFTSVLGNGFPDYSNAEIKNLLSQNLSAPTTLQQLIATERSNISANPGMNATSLSQTCERISEDLAANFALTKSDRAFVLKRILSAHAKFNKPLPSRSTRDTERLETLRELVTFTNLECLASYREIIDEPAYGLRFRTKEYQEEIDRIKSDIVIFDESRRLLQELAKALKTQSREHAIQITGSNFLDTTADITIENRITDSGLYAAGIAPVATMTSTRAAEILMARLFPGRVGCFVGLSDEQLRASLFASGFKAYALYKSQDPSVGNNGWVRIIIDHRQGETGTQPLVRRLSLSSPDHDEASFLTQKAGSGSIDSTACQNLLKEYQTQTVASRPTRRQPVQGNPLTHLRVIETPHAS
jgi:hypothetical protein